MTLVNDALEGRYQLREIIGRGGMGIVYRAWDAVLGREVAIKVLSSERADDASCVARFEREARTAAALQHANIVAVFDTGSEAGRRFIVMEYVPGRDLAALLRERGRVSPSQAVAIARSIAAALAAAHGARVIHRDIKPANVLIDRAGTVKVTDFGIARVAGGTTLTDAALVLGSAPYLAPEVIRGERADERSDIYSLGCVVYELLTGRPPFTGQHAAAVMHQQTSARPRPLQELAPAIPASLAELVRRMLAKRPQARPQSAASVGRELERSLPGSRAAAALSPSARAPRSSAKATAATRVLAPRPSLTRRGKIARRGGLALAAGSVVALAIVLGFSGHRHDSRVIVSTPARTAPAIAQPVPALATRASAPTTPSASATPASAAPATRTAPPAAPASAPGGAAADLGGHGAAGRHGLRHGAPPAPAAKKAAGAKKAAARERKDFKPAKHHGH